MNLRLYKTSDSQNVINKTLTDPVDIDILLRRDVDLNSPDFILENLPGVDYRDYNYCVLTDIGKHYFISNHEIMSYQVTKLDCECDVLETYKADILASSGFYKRKMEAGDYGEIEFDKTGKVIVDRFDSDVTVALADNYVMSVMRWA